MVAIHKRNNIQALELVDGYFPDLFAGKKRATWRYQEQPIETGFLVFEASRDPGLLALVWAEAVDYVPLADVGTVLENETSSPAELLSRMQKHYPDIKLTSEIMIVRHRSPSETFHTHGIPDTLRDVFGPDYIQRMRQYD